MNPTRCRRDFEFQTFIMKKMTLQGRRICREAGEGLAAALVRIRVAIFAHTRRDIPPGFFDQYLISWFFMPFDYERYFNPRHPRISVSVWHPRGFLAALRSIAPIVPRGLHRKVSRIWITEGRHVPNKIP